MEKETKTDSREIVLDMDTIMTSDEEERYEGAMRELAESKTTSVEMLKRELKI